MLKRERMEKKKKKRSAIYQHNCCDEIILKVIVEEKCELDVFLCGVTEHRPQRRILKDRRVSRPSATH